MSSCNYVHFFSLFFFLEMYQGTYRVALWRGTQVAVKQLEEDVFSDENKVWVDHILSMDFVVYL